MYYGRKGWYYFGAKSIFVNCLLIVLRKTILDTVGGPVHAILSFGFFLALLRNGQTSVVVEMEDLALLSI